MDEGAAIARSIIFGLAVVAAVAFVTWTVEARRSMFFVQLRFEQALGGNSVALATQQQQDRWFICDERGKVLPILFGALEKAGSQTLYDDLHYALRGPRGCRKTKCKEIQYFHKHFSPVTRPYNSLFGQCERYSTGRVVSDFTPSFFYWHDVPEQVKITYGAKYQEIVFMMGLREPMARTLSAYAHSKPGHWITYTAPSSNFTEHIDSFFKSWDSVGDPARWISNFTSHLQEFRTVDQSLYYYCIRRFLDAGFLPSQFIVYPATLYLKNRDSLDTNPVLEAARRKLGPHTLRVRTSFTSPSGSNRNIGHHKSIEESLTESQAKRLRAEVYNPANEKLMQLLADQHRKGMILVGYTGQVGDVAAVTEWMTSQWTF